MSSYQDPIIKKVIEDFEPNGPSRLEGKWINGDVLLPAKSELPLAYITKENTDAFPASNMEDEHLMPLVATIVWDLTEDFDGIYNMVKSTNDLYELMEARNDDYTLKTDSLLYRATLNQQLDNKLWIGVGTPVRITYGLGIGRRGPGIFSLESSIRFSVRLHTPRPGLA